MRSRLRDTARGPRLRGAEVGRAGLPARPYLGLSDEAAADLDAIIDDWLEQQIQ